MSYKAKGTLDFVATIAKHLGVDRSTVVKYLIQNGLNPKDNLYKTKKVGGNNEE